MESWKRYSIALAACELPPLQIAAMIRLTRYQLSPCKIIGGICTMSAFHHRIEAILIGNESEFSQAI